MSWRALLVVVTAVLLKAGDAFACAVCGSAKAPNDWAFGLTTVVLSVSPPIIFGGIVLFVVLAHRRAQRRDALASIAPPAE